MRQFAVSKAFLEKLCIEYSGIDEYDKLLEKVDGYVHITVKNDGDVYRYAQLEIGNLMKCDNSTRVAFRSIILNRVQPFNSVHTVKLYNIDIDFIPTFANLTHIRLEKCIVRGYIDFSNISRLSIGGTMLRLSHINNIIIDSAYIPDGKIYSMDLYDTAINQVIKLNPMLDLTIALNIRQTHRIDKNATIWSMLDQILEQPDYDKVKSAIMMLKDEYIPFGQYVVDVNDDQFTFTIENVAELLISKNTTIGRSFYR
jgi:hypothetical protein